MYIHPNHNGNSSSGVATQLGLKKRRLDLQVDYTTTGCGDNTGSLIGHGNGGVTYLNSSVVQVQHRQAHRSLNAPLNNVQVRSPGGGVPQQFIRASTIKLLDTYQRCGQKVRTQTTSTTKLTFVSGLICWQELY